MKRFQRLLVLVGVMSSLLVGAFVFLRARVLDRKRFDLPGNASDQVNRNYKPTPRPLELLPLVASKANPIPSPRWGMGISSSSSRGLFVAPRKWSTPRVWNVSDGGLPGGEPIGYFVIKVNIAAEVRRVVVALQFRAIEVRRGNRVIQTLDLYDYLLKGDAAGDIRLEQGDQIFIPSFCRRPAGHRIGGACAD